MSPFILFLLLATGLFVMAYVLRVHSSATFIAVVSGFLATQFLSDDSGYLNVESSMQWLQLAVFAAPIVLIVYFMRKSMPSAQFILQFLPHAGVSLMAFVLLLPYLPQNMQATLETDPLARTFMNANDAVILFAVIFQLILMVLTSRPVHDHHKKH